jgi:hypothetical protein
MKTYCLFSFCFLAANAVIVATNVSPSSSLLSGVNDNDEGSKKSKRNLQVGGLVNFWNLDEPLWEYGGNVFELNYIFNDMIEDSMISYVIYDKDCLSGGGNTIPLIDTGYAIEITNDGTPIGDGSGTKGNSLKFMPTTTINQNTIIYDGDYIDETDGHIFAYADLCVRVSLSTQNGIEVNFIESKINIEYAFTNGFFVIDDINVRPPIGKLSLLLSLPLLLVACCLLLVAVWVIVCLIISIYDKTSVSNLQYFF